MAKDVSTSKIADNTEGFSGSDLRQLCTAAAMCGIRELMKATSKSSKDKAAAKKVRSAAKHGAVSGSSTIKGAAADTAGPSQQHDKESCTGKGEESASMSGAGQQSQPAEEASASVPATAADEPSASSASAAADQAKQPTQGMGTKRNIDENSSSSGLTKRLKATIDGLDSADKTGTQSSTARSTEVEQSDDAGTSNSAAASTSSPTHATGSTATSQQLPNQQHADSSTQKTCRTIDWLLAKYKEVAAAADQQVRKLATLVLCLWCDVWSFYMLIWQKLQLFVCGVTWRIVCTVAIIAG